MLAARAISANREIVHATRSRRGGTVAERLGNLNLILFELYGEALKALCTERHIAVLLEEEGRTDRGP